MTNRPGDAETLGPSRVDARWTVRLAAVALVVPAWVAALRAGIGGYVPIGDTAIMALRAPDVLSAHPPLVGMPASGASVPGQVVHFPGALQLYWLAIPVKVLGSTWGTVLAMGALNTIWILAAAWLLRRNLDRVQTLWCYAVIAVFLWSLGAGMLIDSWPLKMVVVPFMLLLVAAWAAACGDLKAVVVLAVVASYLWLDHLVVILMTPVVGLAGLVGLWFWFRKANRDDPDGRVLRRKGVIVHLAVAAVVTFVLWLPTLIQQVRGSPGNLTMLVRGADNGHERVQSMTAAFHVVVELLGRPPFWFRGTLEDPTFYHAHVTGYAMGAATWLDVVVLFVWVALFAVLGVSSFRHGDRVACWGLIIAVVGLAASLATVYVAPETSALVPEYFLAVWATVMFAWLAVLLALVRRIAFLQRVNSSWVALGTIAIAALLSLPLYESGYTADMAATRASGHMIDRVIPDLAGRGRIAVTVANPFFEDANARSALLLAMSEAGIPFCYTTPNTSLYTFIPDCDGTERTRILVQEATKADRPPGRVLFSRRLYPDAAAVPGELDDRVEDWLASTDELQLAPESQRPFLGPTIPQLLSTWVDGFEPRNGSFAHLARSPRFWDLIDYWYRRSDNRGEPLFADCPLSGEELEQWAMGRKVATTGIWVVEQR